MAWFAVPKTHEVKLCSEREVRITSEPLGDIWQVWSAKLRRQDAPTVAEILRASEGRWMYKPVRLRLTVDDPPVLLWLSVHTHPTLKGIKREYLFAETTVPLFKHDTFEMFKAELTGHMHQIVLLTLPGDEIFIDIWAKHKFSGSLETLFCAS